ncbi:hypothetical protein M8818_004530 [Zalaria obscura]|uniref:Uncharacterized protein n=1 Tax=Zalaria obscura TaxID=2024903 RepID=A0ACC3SEG9_9PEZI
METPQRSDPDTITARLSSLLTLSLGALSLLRSVQAFDASTVDVFGPVTIFDPPENYTVPRTLYARTLLLNQDCETNNVLLATWENYLPNNDSHPYTPIYQSYDGGKSWSERSRVYDQVNGWGLRYQPFLYELSQSFGHYSAGTVLLAVNSIPDDLSETQIDLYASKDKGHTWKFVSHIAHGGEALPDNGLTPVWEPFLMEYNNSLVCYYSDQRDPAHGQKLVHQVTTDLVHWGSIVNDVAYSNYTFRPGMTTVVQLANGSYIMTYEFYGAVEADFAVYYRINDNPLDFNNSPGQALISIDGTVPVSSPYVVWTPSGGPLGTIAVSCGTYSEIFLNHASGAPGAWIKAETQEPISYTRSLRVLPNENRILIAGGGVLSGTNNSVTASVVDISYSPAGPKLAQCSKKGKQYQA